MLIKMMKTGAHRNVAEFRARALIRVGLATEVPVYLTRDMRPKNPELPQVSEVEALRRDYTEIYGKKPFMGWDANTLRQKIDEKLNQ